MLSILCFFMFSISYFLTLSILYFFMFSILFHRDDEFSPLKNGAGAAKDTAETSRNALFQQHRCPLIILSIILCQNFNFSIVNI